MIYWYTGQPGHGKTLHAIDHAITLRDEGRLVYVCNVTDFNYEKARMLPMTPEQFCNWMEFLPDGAVALVDEAYEHGMLPKRPAGSKVPKHVEQLAKHRHRGLDFIFVSQSPAKQVDEFIHDLIEQQIHVRRMWGLPFAWLRKFFYMERNPLKATPNVVQRVRLPKRPFGLYKSTSMDTTQKHVPWYVFALLIGIPSTLGGVVWSMNAVEDSFQGQGTADVVAAQRKNGSTPEEDGARATADDAGGAVVSRKAELRKKDYTTWLTPRIGGQPWTAPAYDHLSVPNQPPRIFCMASGHDGHDSCSCLTEQGTRYVVEQNRCRMIAVDGQYEPFLDEVEGDRRRLDATTQLRRLASQELSAPGQAAGAGASAAAAMIPGNVKTVAGAQ
jgi:hypothetical protein